MPSAARSAESRHPQPTKRGSLHSLRSVGMTRAMRVHLARVSCRAQRAARSRGTPLRRSGGSLHSLRSVGMTRAMRSLRVCHAERSAQRGVEAPPPTTKRGIPPLASLGRDDTGDVRSFGSVMPSAARSAESRHSPPTKRGIPPLASLGRDDTGAFGRDDTSEGLVPFFQSVGATRAISFAA
jgi:hypothetical protein